MYNLQRNVDLGTIKHLDYRYVSSIPRKLGSIRLWIRWRCLRFHTRFHIIQYLVWPYKKEAGPRGTLFPDRYTHLLSFTCFFLFRFSLRFFLFNQFSNFLLIKNLILIKDQVVFKVICDFLYWKGHFLSKK